MNTAMHVIFLKRAAFAVACIFSTIITGVAFAQNNQCASEDGSVTYFRRLAAIESMAEKIVGIGPVTREASQTIAHFRIESDGCGDIVRVGYFHGDTPKPIDENFTGNAFTPSSQTIFENNGNQTTVKFFDHAGNPTTVHQRVESIVISQDKQGRLTRIAYRDPEGAVTSGPSGYAIATWDWRRDNTAVETRFDANEEAIVSGSGFRFSSAHLMFEEHGLLSEIGLNDETLNVTYERQEDGALQAWRAHDATGGAVSAGAARVHGANYAYDENGYLIRLTYVDQAEHPTLSAFGHMGFARSYRNDGNRLSYNFANADGQVWAPPQRGYAGQNYQWREDGLVRVRTEYVDANGALINHPQRNYAVILYDFDEDAHVTSRLFLDAAERPLYERIP